MRIQFKLILVSFVVVALLMTIVGFVHIRTSQQISDRLDTIDRISDVKSSLVDPALHHTSHLSVLNERTLAIYYQYAIGGVVDAENEIEELHDEFDEHLEILDAAAAAAAAAGTSPLIGETISHIAVELEAVEEIHALHHKVHNEQFIILQSLVVEGQQNEAEQNEAEQYVINTIKPIISNIRIKLSSLEGHLEEEEENTEGIAVVAIHDAAEEAASATAKILYVSIIVYILFMLIFGLYVSKVIARPLKDLQFTASKVIAGDYTVRSRVNGKDDIAQLAMAFNSMIDSLIQAQDLPKSILQSLKDSLFVVNEQGMITEINQAGLDALGYKKDELIGQPINKVFGSMSHNSSGTVTTEHSKKRLRYVPAPEDD